MTIFSVKYWEVPELRRLKARIVFRGDDIRDQANNLAVLQEGKINPSGLAGINVNLAYGSLKGHTSSQSDVVRVYTQSFLNTKVPTWVELSVEFLPEKFCGIKRPCVHLWKNLYGYLEAGYHWDQRFKEMMREIGSIHCADIFQSIYFIKELGLLLILYNDNMVLSGPESQHNFFWEKIQKHSKIEEPTPLDHILGRYHKISKDEYGTAM